MIPKIDLKILNKRKNAKLSKGESIVKSHLDEYKIDYKIEHTFEWLRNSRCNQLYLDFYLPKHKIAIEYNGKQHYLGSKNLSQGANDLQKIDLLKNNFIKYLELPYWLTEQQIKDAIHECIKLQNINKKSRKINVKKSIKRDEIKKDRLNNYK